MTTLSFNVVWNGAAAQRGMQALGTQAAKTKSSFDHLNKGAGLGLGSIAKGLAGPVALIAKLGAGAVLGFGAAAGAAAGFGVKVASANEQAKISFTTMLGSAKRADVFLRQLQRFAAKTPFEFPELQTAASSLISVGIKADKIIPIMTSLGNATAGMGTGAEGVKRATVALQQMTAAGRITAEDLNQLRDAGVPVFELLTKATGKSTAEIAKMAQNGKLGRKELEQLMKALESGKGLERFAGLMDKQSHSLAGLWSTFKDTAKQAAGDLASSAFPIIKSGLDGISTGLGHMSAWVKDNKGALGSVFKVLGSTLSTLAGTVKTVFTSFAQSAGLGKSSFKDFADFLATHQEDITRGVISGAKAFISFGKTVAIVASGALRGFGLLADGIGVSVAFITNQYADMAHGAALAFGWIPGIGPKLMAADVQFRLFATGIHNDMHKTGDSARTLADGIDKNVIPAFDKAGRGLDAYGKKAITSARAQDALARAGIAHRKVLDAALAGVKAYGKGLDTNTAAGVLNRRALNGLVTSSQTYISRLAATHAGSKRVTAATRDARDEFVRVAVKMGVSRKRADELAAAYFHIPTKHVTTVTQPGMHGKNGALESAAELKTRISKIKDKTVRLSMQFNASANKATVALFKHVPGSQASGLVGVQVRAAGGPIQNLSGRGIKGKDTEPVVAAVGEHMWTDKEVDAVGGHSAMYRMRSDARAGRFKGYADGGPISRYLRINTSSNALPSASANFYPGGVKLASELGSDAMRALSSAATKALNAAIAASMGGPGGPIGGKGYAAALAYARRHRGHPYIFGTLWDCSGFMSALHSIILGQSPHRRYSTPAFHGAHAAGFTRGKRSPFMVGVRPLAGRFGHMAGTLNGVNVESAGGVGVRVGGSARGYNNRMFSWRGGLARGGPVTRGMGDLPFDLLDPQGERYNPELADLVHKAGYHRGGRIGTRGPERVLSPPQNRAFEHLVRVMDRRTGGPGVTVNQYVSIPHYVGSVSDLKRALVDLSRRGELAVITR